MRGWKLCHLNHVSLSSVCGSGMCCREPTSAGPKYLSMHMNIPIPDVRLGRDAMDYRQLFVVLQIFFFWNN